MPEITIPYAQYIMQAEAAVRALRRWHEKLPPHEHIEDCCVFNHEDHAEVIKTIEDRTEILDG